MSVGVIIVVVVVEEGVVVDADGRGTGRTAPVVPVTRRRVHVRQEFVDEAVGVEGTMHRGDDGGLRLFLLGVGHLAAGDVLFDRFLSVLRRRACKVGRVLLQCGVWIEGVAVHNG